MNGCVYRQCPYILSWQSSGQKRKDMEVAWPLPYPFSSVRRNFRNTYSLKGLDLMLLDEKPLDYVLYIEKKTYE
jgi:hypothetical protein